MRNLNRILFTAVALFTGAFMLCSATTNGTAATSTKGQNLKVAIVNFKQCVEKSKVGKQEQTNFENMKKQMETVLADKEKTLMDMAGKLEDADYLDSLSPEAETDLKRKFRALSQEMSQQQQQYMQTLQQTNFKVVAKITEDVTKAAETIAKEEGIDIVFNEEAAFFVIPELDLSNKVIALLDKNFDSQTKEPATK